MKKKGENSPKGNSPNENFRQKTTPTLIKTTPKKTTQIETP